MQAKQLQYGLQSSHQQSNVLNTELQHRCDQVEELTRDHNALLSKFKELTVLMSEAHNKLNSAVAQSGKAMAKDHTKVSKMWLAYTHAIIDSKTLCGQGYIHCCYCIDMAVCHCFYLLHSSLQLLMAGLLTIHCPCMQRIIPVIYFTATEVHTIILMTPTLTLLVAWTGQVAELCVVVWIQQHATVIPSKMYPFSSNQGSHTGLGSITHCAVVFHSDFLVSF